LKKQAQFPLPLQQHPQHLQQLLFRLLQRHPQHLQQHPLPQQLPPAQQAPSR